MDNGRVSIIVPVYNAEKYLAKCLGSLIAQTYANFEVLVVDDGSIDSSPKIIKEFAQKDSRIIAITQENEGVASARNKALSYATGDYYTFVDSDDYVKTDYLSRLVTEAENYNSDLVVSGYILEKKNKQTIVCPKKKQGKISEEWAYRICCACGRLYKASFWKKCKFRFVTEPGSRGEDVPIAIESVYRANNLRIVDYAGYYYVQHKGSAMNSNKKVPFLFPYVAFSEMYKRCEQCPGINSRDLFYSAIIKTLAQFKFTIYLRADRNLKYSFLSYYENLLDSEFRAMYFYWKRDRKKIEYPIFVKAVINLFFLCDFRLLQKRNR